jgi:hypothetical protein
VAVVTRKRLHGTCELLNGRVAQYKGTGGVTDKKTVPGYLGTLDMSDPDSIRAYVADTIAMSTDPTIAGLKRLEMLMEMADRLPQPEKQGAAGKLVLVDAKRAVEVLRRRVVPSGEGQ